MAPIASDRKGTSTLTFHIDGMARSGCVERVDAALRATAGYEAALDPE